MTNEKRIKEALRCHRCGVEIEPWPLGGEVVNPGGRLVTVLHLCNTCWKKYKEANV